MPKFVFQLDGVLRQRKHIEREKQRELAVVQAQMAQLQIELRNLNETVQVSNDDTRRNHLTGRLDMNFLAAHRRFIISTQRKALALMHKMALVQRQLDEARKALAEAAKQRKVIEKLREKHRERWMERLSRRELS
ncbi:MAG: flagellar export protein FliJ, partial [Tepidisphaeraceae bacterium]